MDPMHTPHRNTQDAFVIANDQCPGRNLGSDIGDTLGGNGDTLGGIKYSTVKISLWDFIETNITILINEEHPYEGLYMQSSHQNNLFPEFKENITLKTRFFKLLLKDLRGSRGFFPSFFCIRHFFASFDNSIIQPFSAYC